MHLVRLKVRFDTQTSDLGKGTNRRQDAGCIDALKILEVRFQSISLFGIYCSNSLLSSFFVVSRS